ncbi:myrosinase 1-like [Anticarsia gemmatalis]|uniref:myrosinase 1-like n=1 Tax=Anticarsia gemmatalis TaxID=129554 RepID=UPI003F75F568
MKILMVLCAVVAACYGECENKDRSFPSDFLFGCATAAVQIEGGWNADGKGESIWDRITHRYPELVSGPVLNPDVSCDSYNNWKRDVEMMREMGLTAYRFSLSWSRILPKGFANEVNPKGIEYYNNLINEMVKYNITPLVTLYHWDLPQPLQDLGGLANPLITKWFEDYARVAFTNFGDRVKHWITFNEPREVCYEGYGFNNKAPLVNSSAIGTYVCAKNLVLSHANAYHLYDKEFKPIQGGECGITLSVQWFYPMTDSAEDAYAAEIMRQAEWGIYAHPIYSKEGGFPKEFAERVAAKSKEQGFGWSRLGEYTEEEKAWARGTSDFFGINHYTAFQISATKYIEASPVPSLTDDEGFGHFRPAEWPVAASAWCVMAPNSLYNAITFLNNKYNPPKFIITENGWSIAIGRDLIDDDRITYHRAAWEDVLDLLAAGVNVKGYMAWSLMDNWEWLGGVTERFGLYAVDFEDPARTRTARKSAFVYKQLIKDRCIDYSYNPTNLTMTIDE